jgi:tetratricopeptide (TPR) repeat protein
MMLSSAVKANDWIGLSVRTREFPVKKISVRSELCTTEQIAFVVKRSVCYSIGSGSFLDTVRQDQEVLMQSITRLLVILFAVSIMLTPLALAAGQQDVSKLYEKGLELQKAGKLKEALSLYNQCIGNDPKNYRALKAAGMAYYALGDYSKAAETLRMLLSYYPDDTGSAVYLAYCNLRLGKPEQAADALQLILVKHPRNVAAMIGLGWAQYLLGNRLVALDQFKKALALQPSNKTLQTTVARMQDSVQQYLKDKKAQRNYKIMSDLNNTIAEAHVILARERGILQARQANQSSEAMRKLMVLGDLMGGGTEPDYRGSRAVRGVVGKENFDRR